MELHKNLVLRFRDETLKGRVIARVLSDHAYWLGGFYTLELRSGSSREGFELRTLDGYSGILASKKILSPVSFNKYGVDMRVLDGPAAESLSAARLDGRIALMDELGPIALGSRKLSAAVLETLASETPCLAAFRGNAAAFESTFARMTDTGVLELDGAHLEQVRAGLKEWLEFRISKLPKNG